MQLRCNGSLHTFYSVLKYRNKNTTSRRKCQYLSATFLRFLSEFYSRLEDVHRSGFRPTINAMRTASVWEVDTVSTAVPVCPVVLT